MIHNMLSIVIFLIALSTVTVITGLIGDKKTYLSWIIMFSTILMILIIDVNFGDGQLLSNDVLIVLLTSILAFSLWINSRSVEIIMISCIVAGLVFGVQLCNQLEGNGSLLTYYLILEIQSMAMCVMLGLSAKKNHLKSEGVIKVYILNAVGSVWLLTGIALFVVTNNIATNMGLSSFTILNHKYTFGEVMVLFGLMIKLGMMPFHSWVLDCYTTTSYRMISMISVIPKMTVILFVSSVRSMMPFVLIGLMVFSVISIIFGCIALIVQKDIRKFMTYSGIMNVGYITLYIIVMLSNNLEHIMSLWHMLAYLASSIPLAIILDRKDIVDEKDLISFALRHRVLGLILSLSLIFLAGFPPTFCFISKFFMAKDILLYGHDVFGINSIIIVMPMLITSAVACYAYIRLIYLMYLSNISGDVIEYKLSSN